MSRVQTQRALRERLGSPGVVLGLVLTQLIAAIAYAAFLFDPRPTQSDARANLELVSFFVAPFVWALLFLADLWLLRQPLSRRHALAVRGGLLATGMCAAVAIAFAAIFVFAAAVFWLTDF